MRWYKIKPLCGIKFDDKYQINKAGEIRNRHTGYIYHNNIRETDGRTYISLVDTDGCRHNVLLSRVVANTFIGSVDGMVVNHLNFEPTKNDVSNLEICTQKENIQYSIDAGRIKRRGEDSSSYKGIFTEVKVRQICELLSSDSDMTYSEILKEVDIVPSKTTLDMMTKIRTGKLWKHVSSEYPIPDYKQRPMNTFTQYKKQIIDLINDGVTDVRRIADILNIDISDKKVYLRFWKYVDRYRKQHS